MKFSAGYDDFKPSPTGRGQNQGIKWRVYGHAGAVFGVIVTLAGFWSFGQLTIRSAESPDGLYMAQVEMSLRAFQRRLHNA